MAEGTIAASDTALAEFAPGDEIVHTPKDPPSLPKNLAMVLDYAKPDASRTGLFEVRRVYPR